MIGVSARVFDLNGDRIFNNTDRSYDVKNRSGARRVSRTATLDGGASVADTGYSYADKTILVQIPDAPLADIVFAEYICKTYQLVTVCTDDGAYLAIPESHSVDVYGALTFTLLVTEILSEE